MTPTQPNKPEDTKTIIECIAENLSVEIYAAAVDRNRARLKERIMVHLTSGLGRRFAPLLAQNAALQADTAQARKVIEGCNAWIAEAKPLLERGGEAERENKTLKSELVQIKSLQENDAECASRLEREVAALQAQVEGIKNRDNYIAELWRAISEYQTLIQDYKPLRLAELETQVEAANEGKLNLTAELVRVIGHAVCVNRKLISDPITPIVASDINFALQAMDKYGDLKEIARHTSLTHIRDDVRAALTRCAVAGLTASEDETK